MDQIKDVLKKQATAAAQEVGLKHRERRSFILAEVRNLLQLARAVPGLLGPKFPVFVAAASMARTEIRHYFRHRPLECRKDVKKNLNSDDYYCSQVTLLMDALYELCCVVEEYREVVMLYYGEFLSLCDAPVLQDLCAAALAELPETAQPAISSILLSLPNYAHDASAGRGSDLAGLRMDWDRYSTLIGTRWGKFAGGATAALTTRMLAVRVRSEFVDSLPALMKRYFLPYELWWHTAALSEAFDRGFEHEAKPLAVFSALSFVSLSVHADNLLEAKELSRLARQFCDLLMNKLSKHLTAALDSYWSSFDDLEKKTLGKEAMARLEKQYSVKQARDKALASGKKESSMPQTDQHPGSESEGWAAQSLQGLVRVRAHLLRVTTAVRTLGAFVIFDREYDVEIATREAFSYYFSAKLKKIVSQKGEISRPSVTLKSVVVGCRVMQSVANFLSFDLSQLLRTFLFDNFCDTSTSPPGAVRKTRCKLDCVHQSC